MASNPLNYVSDKVRLGVYAVISVITLVIGAIQVGYAALEAANPDWLTVAIAVVPFVAAGLGFTAATHVRPSEANKRAESTTAGRALAKDPAEKEPPLH